ncbi:YtrH family sporulation protein [Orenia marismortui]|uniref:Sporulation protein YtrH n=1 Tax=Orenia marismortui TaxID=46469 RepID=A0A4V6QBG1_9FIRM|nr:YtrH family sporulation protein [Orenia marismortui]TDX58949.1 sporulation protein YtrH [Orenia marismortui]
MARLSLVFFISLGVVLGGSILGSIGATLAKESPIKIMSQLSQEIKLWAVVTAMGGTFSHLRIIEGGMFEGKFILIFKQFILLMVAFLGAQLGIWLISIITGGN